AHLGAQAEVGAQVGLDPRAERGREARLALELRRLGDEARGAETRTDVRAKTGLLLAEEVVARELVDLDRQVEARLAREEPRAREARVLASEQRFELALLRHLHAERHAPRARFLHLERGLLAGLADLSADAVANERRQLDSLGGGGKGDPHGDAGQDGGAPGSHGAIVGMLRA